jgi:hypothetical protein
LIQADELMPGNRTATAVSPIGFRLWDGAHVVRPENQPPFAAKALVFRQEMAHL